MPNLISIGIVVLSEIHTIPCFQSIVLIYNYQFASNLQLAIYVDIAPTSQQWLHKPMSHSCLRIEQITQYSAY